MCILPDNWVLLLAPVRTIEQDGLFLWPISAEPAADWQLGYAVTMWMRLLPEPYESHCSCVERQRSVEQADARTRRHCCDTGRFKVF